MSTYVITDLRPISTSFIPTNTSSRPTSTSFRPTDRAAGVRSGRLRLTRRGRVVIFLLALVAVLAFSVMIGGGSVATSEKGTPTPTEVIVVGQGDTLWAISSGIAAETGEKDVRNVMSAIEELNGLESGMLRAGQELRVPLTD